MFQGRSLASRDELLLPHVAIAQKDSATGSPTQIILDGCYQLTVNQNHEVSPGIDDVPPHHVAAIALRSCGVDWPTTKRSLGDLYLWNTFDDRLDSDIFALDAIGYCYSRHLLDVKRLPVEERESRGSQLNDNELRALAVVARGTMSRQDTRTLLTLHNLNTRMETMGFNVLSAFTKAMTNRCSLRQAVQNQSTITSERSLKVDTEPPALYLRRTVFVNAKNIQEREKFVSALSNGVLDLRRTSRPRTVEWKGARLTFALPGLSGAQQLAVTGYVLGLRHSEISALIDGMNVRSLLKAARRNLGIPQGMDVTLWAMAKGFITYDKPAKMPEQARHTKLPTFNLMALRASAEDGASLKKIAGRYNSTEISRYTYNRFGTTNERETVLMAATHKLITLCPKEVEDQ